MNIQSAITLCIYLFIGPGLIYAQGNLELLVAIAKAGKNYALYPAKSGDQDIFSLKETHYLKIVPAKYQTVYDTLEITPALNGNLDTSNYFIQTEVLILKESTANFKTATVSPFCNEDEELPYLTLGLVKTTPDYSILHRKFFPFKNILDTTITDYIIPAETIVIKRIIQSQKSRIYYLTDKHKSNLLAGEKLEEIPAGNWKKWSEIQCNSKESNNTSIASVQEALLKQAYNVIINGKFDKQTKDALHAFQQDNLLDVGNDINNPTTLQRLGIKRKKLITFE